jgi:hypothetical protein
MLERFSILLLSVVQDEPEVCFGAKIVADEASGF